MGRFSTRLVAFGEVKVCKQNKYKYNSENMVEGLGVSGDLFTDTERISNGCLII